MARNSTCATPSVRSGDQYSPARFAVALLVEVGVDVVIDPHGAPWLIEVNSRPRGRLEVLARLDPARFGHAHVDACARPLRVLAERMGLLAG